MEIGGKIALVTGAATGIGRATAIALARKGARRVILADIAASAMAETAGGVRAAGAEAVERRVDLSRMEEVHALFEFAAASGGLDILVSNAGIMSGPPAFPDTPAARIPLLFAVNLVALVLGARLAMDIMRARGGGAIVNMSSQGALRYGRQSVAGRSELVEDAPYAASKAGIQMFTQSCAPLRESCNIRVNAVCPGVVETPILASTGRGAPADWLKPQLARTRALAPSDIAAAVIAMIEDESKAGDYIHVPNV